MTTRRRNAAERDIVDRLVHLRVQVLLVEDDLHSLQVKKQRTATMTSVDRNIRIEAARKSLVEAARAIQDVWTQHLAAPEGTSP